jgi:hypothetical protein
MLDDDGTIAAESMTLLLGDTFCKSQKVGSLNGKQSKNIVYA